MVDIAPGTHVSRILQEEVGTRFTPERARVVDRVRWPAVVAGLFGTLSILAVLTVLGVAIGASAADAGDNPTNFGIGAGIWGLISGLIAFAAGGWIAAGCSALRGRNNALIQGATVWMVTIGLLVYLVAGGIGAAARVAGDQTAINRTGDNVNVTTPAGNTNANTNVSNEDINRAAESTAKGAWTTFAAMVLGLGASLAGAYLGSRGRDHPHGDDDSYVAPATAG